MRAREFVLESGNIANIGKHLSDGSLEGYVVDTLAPQLKNYLQSQHANPALINSISNKFSRIGIIRNLYVDEESRGQGLGNNLMNYAIDRAFDEGAEAILLISDSGEENQFDLTNWYEGFGFEVIGDAAGDPVMLLNGQLNELSFLGSPCTKDCSGHRAGYAWSQRKGGQVPNSWSQSFNNGAALQKAGK